MSFGHRTVGGAALLVAFTTAIVSNGSRTVAHAQELTSALVGTVTDPQGGVIRDAAVRLASPFLIGGPLSERTDARGQFRFPGLAPGLYVLDVERSGFAPYHEDGIRLGAGATVEKLVALPLAGVAESVRVVSGPDLEARSSGLEARFDSDYLRTMPSRRASMFDAIRATPGVSATSPSSATTTTVTALGSGVNENAFLIDGTNTTCPCNGVARAEIGVDFIQEIQVRSAGASAEFGNIQGAVFNVITRQGGDRYAYDLSYYVQPPALTSQPVLLQLETGEAQRTGYARERYRDLTTDLGGPLVRGRAWFFAGYQYLRDFDSQPGSDPAYPRRYEQNKLFAKLTWKPAAGMRLQHTYHQERWVRPDPPTSITPFEATLRRSAWVPALTFAHLSHTLSSRVVYDASAGRFFYDEDRTPSSGDLTTPSRIDRDTGVTTAAPPQIGGLTLIRTTARATLTTYVPRILSVDHEVKFGAQWERGEQIGANVIPTGMRFEDRAGQPSRRISSDPSRTAGLALSASAFVTDAIALANRITLNAGIRFDSSRAVSQDVNALDRDGNDTSEIVRGLGTLYTWNVVSPRLGLTAKLTRDSRTVLRSTYGRFHQGVLTGEFTAFHPGVTPVLTHAFDAASGTYSRLVRSVDSSSLQFDPDTRSPYTDTLTLAVDREIAGQTVLTGAYVRKRGRDFIGWTEIGGRYQPESRVLPDGRSLSVLALTNSTRDQRFFLTNPENYSLAYDGFLVGVAKRLSRGWQLSGSYTFSRTVGLQASSGSPAAAPQASTVAQPTMSFGRDPNELTNAYGRLPNDRAHMLRATGTFDIPRVRVLVAASFQQLSGKPWTATTEIELPQGVQRVMLEPRGSRRLASQSLLDVRFSREFRVSAAMTVELFVDILNALNETAAEGLASDDLFAAGFGRPTLFVDPRRAMFGARVNLGR
jgi:hypothetical protein